MKLPRNFINSCGLFIVNVSLLHAADTPTIGIKEGQPASVHCPNGEYLAGVAIWSDNSISGLQPYCVRMMPNGAWETGAHVAQDRKMSDAISGRRLDLFCAKDRFVTGFSGHTHVYGINSLMQLSLSCLNLTNGVSNSIGTSKPAGVSLTEWPGVRCGSESVANGVVGTVRGATIIQFGLSCQATPRTLVQGANGNPQTQAAREVAPATPAWTQQTVSGQANRSRMPISKAPEPAPPPNEIEAAPASPGGEPRQATAAGDRGIIIVGGNQARPGDDVTLNPQPLPPKGDPVVTQQQQATANPSGNVALNPQPLPPKTTLYQPRQAPVLQSAPAQTRSAESSGVNPQGQIQGASAGYANDSVVAPQDGAGQDLAGQLLCQGGETPAISSAYRTADDGTEIHMMYFGFANDSARADGSGLAPGRCAFFDQSLAGSGASIVYFRGSAADREKLRQSMVNKANYWRFKVTKNAQGYYDASEYAPWTPRNNPAQVLTFTRIRVTPAPRGVEFRFDGPANSKPELMIVNGPLKKRPGGSSSFNGPPLHLQAVRVSDPKPSGVAEFLASSEQHRNTKAAGEWLKLVPGSRYHYSLSNSGAVSRQEGDFVTPAEPQAVAASSGAIATSAGSPELNTASAGGYSSQDPIRQQARIPGTTGSKLKMDCETREPRVHFVRGAISAGRQFTVEGSCLGDSGSLELIGQFAGGSLVPKIELWGPAAIVASIPKLQGVPDHPVALSVLREPDHKRSDAKKFAYVAEREIVEVPADNITPAPLFKDTLKKMEWGEWKRTNKVKPPPVVYQVRKNPACALDRTEAVARIGTVLSVEESDPVPSQPAQVTVQWNWHCKYDVKTYLVGGTRTDWDCNIDYQVRAWASCPVGIAP
jgi:hypothetical protein